MHKDGEDGSSSLLRAVVKRRWRDGCKYRGFLLSSDDLRKGEPSLGMPLRSIYGVTVLRRGRGRFWWRVRRGAWSEAFL